MARLSSPQLSLPRGCHPLPRREHRPWPWWQRVATLAAPLLFCPAALANSPLLETVKQNPTLARQLCSSFQALNAQGQSATAAEAIAVVARNQGLSAKDAEVLTIYVIGLHCPDVR